MIKQGTVFLLSHGEYSDFSNITLLRATADLDPLALRDEFNQTNEPSTYGFANWLTNVKQIAEEVPYVDWWIGAYGSLTFSLNDVRAFT